MGGPTIFDWIAAVRHKPFGSNNPWLASHSHERVASIPASVLALHVPSASASGSGHLVVTESSEAAFITAGGVCWEIGLLQPAIEQMYEASDGSLQVFLCQPTSLHVTIDVAHATDFLRVLNGPNGTAGEDYSAAGEALTMGIFGKSKPRDGAPLLAFPRSATPPPSDIASTHAFLVQSALSRTGDSAIAGEDVSSYMDAMYAHVLGIADSEQIIAWGPATIRTPQDNKEREGSVAVTRQSMLAWWQPGRTSLIHTFHANHSGATSVEPMGLWTSLIQWQVGEYADNRGKFLVGEPAVQLAARFGNDGQENRRALTWFVTLMHLLGAGPGPAPSPGTPSGGLGSEGTKL